MEAKSDSSVVWKDMETLCEWMEPRPTKSWLAGYQPFDPTAPPCPWKWWYWDGMANIYGGWSKPIQLTLEKLHVIEDRLDDGQRKHYIAHVASLSGLQGRFYEDAWVFLHATAEQRIASLAAVIRSSKPHTTNLDGERGDGAKTTPESE